MTFRLPPGIFPTAVTVLMLAPACGDRPTAPPEPTALAVSCPAALSGMSLSNLPVTLNWNANTTGGTAPIQTSCNPASGTAFAAGVTQVLCTATDAAGRSASCSFSISISRPPQIQVTTFLAYGDSITWGKDAPAAPSAYGSLARLLAFPEPPPVTSYPTQLRQLLADRYLDQTIVMTNEGWPGEPVGEGLARLPSAIAAAAPDVLLLLDGANDLLGNPSSATTAYIAARLQDMVRAAKAQLPASQILLATFPPQYHGKDPYDRGAGADFVPELNQRITAVALAEGVRLVDLYSPLLPALHQNIGADGLHPTVKGFTLMAETFAGTIRQAFEVSATSQR